MIIELQSDLMSDQAVLEQGSRAMLANLMTYFTNMTTSSVIACSVSHPQFFLRWKTVTVCTVEMC